VLAEEGTDVVDVVGGKERQAGQRGQPATRAARALAIDGVADGDGDNQGADIGHQATGPIMGAEEPHERRNHQMIQWRVV
jgi:hypothetical protein